MVVNNATLGTAIQDTLTSVQRADEAELLALANARAQEIKQQLVAQGVDEARIFVLDPQPGTAGDGRIRLALTLTD
jgi:type IV pilus biogenesis protein CpaD/CtpE